MKGLQYRRAEALLRSLHSINGFKCRLSSIGQPSVYTSHNKKVWKRKKWVGFWAPSSFLPLISGGRKRQSAIVVALLQDPSL